MWGDYCRSLLIWEMLTLLQLAIYLRGSALTELVKQLVLSWAVNGISLTMQFVLTPPSICWYGSVSHCQQYALDFNRIQSFVKYGRAPWSAIWFHFNEMMYVMELWWPGWDFLCLHSVGASRRFTYIYLQGFFTMAPRRRFSYHCRSDTIPLKFYLRELAFPACAALLWDDANQKENLER